MIGYFLNLGPSSTTPHEASLDIQAILETEPNFFGGCESIAKGTLPVDPDYTKIRQRDPEGRANIFSYTRGRTPKVYEWTDCQIKFDREPGRPGKHAPRSFLSYNFNGAQFTFAHHPPAWPGTDAARFEHLNKLRSRFAPWTDEKVWNRWGDARKLKSRERPRIILWDRNMTLTQARDFAKSMDATVVGEKIDSVIVRHIRINSLEYKKIVNGRKLSTDHPWGCLRIDFTLDKPDQKKDLPKGNS